MKLFTIVLLVIFTSFSISFSQFGLGKILKKKVEEKVEKKTEEEIEKALEGENEEEESEKSEESEGKSTESNTESAAPAAPSMQTYSKFDFIPGDRIIFFEDFSQDNIGDFPVKWNTNGSGEVISTNLYPGKWLKMVNEAIYVPDVKHPFPENFTVEYDVLCNFKLDYPGQLMGYLRAGIAEILDLGNAVKDGYDINSAHTEYDLQFGGVQTAWVKANNKNGTDLGNNVTGTWLNGFHNKPFHISISVNKQRYRMWINQTKLFDLPRLLANDVKYNVLKFEAYSINTSKPYEVLISNIKLAEGTVDTRSKLITEGKLVTNAITFDSGSDKIKPESYSMLKSIADALTANPTVNIMIIGHTDTDGNPANNQTLSEARAIAVKNSLIKDFGIQESRIQTSGKGDKEPVAENTSSEGKAKNRRVEFNKM